MTHSFTFHQQSNVSLREKVTADIRTAILKGNLKPGERIRESDIAAQMGVSRGPVREAIRQLEREGLLVSHPYRETIVADTDVDEIREFLIPIRYHLESTVLRKYAHRMNDSFFGRLEELVDGMRQVETGDLESLVELDLAFHATIVQLAEERTVQMMWQSISHHIHLHFNKNTVPRDQEKLIRDHERLLATLRTKELDRIQQVLLEHVNLF